jgi:hypothetical protein
VDPNPNDPPTALILDGDLGFVLALSHELSNRHVAAFPVRTASEGRSMLTRFRLRPDVLVVDCSYPGACSFAEGIAKECPELKIIAIVSTRYQCKNCAERLAVTLRDPDDTAPERIPHCAEVVCGLLKKRIRFIRNAE